MGRGQLIISILILQDLTKNVFHILTLRNMCKTYFNIFLHQINPKAVILAETSIDRNTFFDSQTPNACDEKLAAIPPTLL